MTDGKDLYDRFHIYAPDAPAGSFDLWRDAPVGMVVMYEGSLSAHPNLPGGANPKWSVIGKDMVFLGADDGLGNDGTEGGTESLDTEGAHTGGSVADHPAESHTGTSVTSGPTGVTVADHPAETHSGASVTSGPTGVTVADHPAVTHTGASVTSGPTGATVTPATHASQGGHTHDAHDALQKGGTSGSAILFSTPVTHASQGAHTHDAHGLTDTGHGHGFTEPSNHAAEVHSLTDAGHGHGFTEPSAHPLAAHTLTDAGHGHALTEPSAHPAASHAFTEPSAHEVKKYHRSYVLRKSIA